MKSRNIFAGAAIRNAKKIADEVKRARLTLYAAQASFFICISAIPFVVLMLTLSKLVIPGVVEDAISLIRESIPEKSRELYDSVCAEVTEKSALPIASGAALSMLWSSSKGLFALIGGISEIYGKRVAGNAVARAFETVVYTAVSVVVLTLSLAILVFGKYFKDDLFKQYGDVPMFLKYREVIAFLVLSFFFSLLYYLVAKGTFSSPIFRWERGNKASVREQFPGGAVAAAGWVAFSYFYSLYFESFPRLSYLYGSLAAVVFLMLWLYFCILILLFGAEINKYLSLRKRTPDKPRKEKRVINLRCGR